MMKQETTDTIWTLWAMGSSIEPRGKYISDAINLLQNLAEFPDLRCYREKFSLEFRSSLIETNPFGQRARNVFLNGLFIARTTCYPEELLFLAKKIEQSCGRRPGYHWSDRELDLDLLLYGKKEINLPHLQLPHAGLFRDYLKPLYEETKDFLNHQGFAGNIFPLR